MFQVIRISIFSEIKQLLCGGLVVITAAEFVCQYIKESKQKNNKQLYFYLLRLVNATGKAIANTTPHNTSNPRTPTKIFFCTEIT